MLLKSINGLLVPISGTPSFLAYYVIVSYDQEIGTETAFQSQTLICEADGSFRFFLAVDDIVDNLVLVEVHAPNGTQVHRRNYTVSSLNPSSTPSGTADTTAPFTIDIEPHTVQEDSLSTSENRIRGKVIEVQGRKVPANLQIIVWGTTDMVAPAFNQVVYRPILVDHTDGQGYFGGLIEPDAYTRLFATLGAAIDDPVEILLEAGDVPNYVILPVSFEESTGVDGDCGCEKGVAWLPDAEELADGAGHFSNDLGGSCNVEIKPNRTLEEFDYCTIVRTTEPQIRRHTITEAELYKVRGRLGLISRQFRDTLQSMKSHLDASTIKAPVADAFEKQETGVVLVQELRSPSSSNTNK